MKARAQIFIKHPSLSLLVLLGGSLFAAAGIACSAEIKDDFENQKTDWIEAPAPFGEHYTLMRGRLKIEDGVVIAPQSPIGTRVEARVNDLTMPDDPAKGYSVGIDFKMPEMIEDGSVVLMLNFESDQHYVLFRLRFGENGRHYSQLIVQKGGQPEKPDGLPLAGPLQAGEWYRLTIDVERAGEYNYQIVEAAHPANIVASGTLRDQSTLGDPIAGGQIGFGANGPSFLLDNFTLKVKP